MSKKEYNKPNTRVVNLRHDPHLLSESEKYYNPNSPGSEVPQPKIWYGWVD